MYEDTQVAGIIGEDADGGELAEAALDQVVGAEAPPPPADHKNG